MIAASCIASVIRRTAPPADLPRAGRSAGRACWLRGDGRVSHAVRLPATAPSHSACQASCRGRGHRLQPPQACQRCDERADRVPPSPHEERRGCKGTWSLAQRLVASPWRRARLRVRVPSPSHRPHPLLPVAPGFPCQSACTNCSRGACQCTLPECSRCLSAAGRTDPSLPLVCQLSDTVDFQKRDTSAACSPAQRGARCHNPVAGTSTPASSWGRRRSCSRSSRTRVRRSPTSRAPPAAEPAAPTTEASAADSSSRPRPCAEPTFTPVRLRVILLPVITQRSGWIHARDLFALNPLRAASNADLSSCRRRV